MREEVPKKKLRIGPVLHFFEVNFANERTPKAKKNLGNEDAVGLQFHNMVHNIVTVHNVPPALCLAADEQFSAIHRGGKWTIAEKGQTQVDLVALDNKRGITLFLDSLEILLCLILNLFIRALPLEIIELCFHKYCART